MIKMDINCLKQAYALIVCVKDKYDDDGIKEALDFAQEYILDAVCCSIMKEFKDYSPFDEGDVSVKVGD